VAATGDGLFEAVDNASSLVPCGHSVLLKRNADNCAGVMPPSTMDWLDVGGGDNEGGIMPRKPSKLG